MMKKLIGFLVFFPLVSSANFLKIFKSKNVNLKIANTVAILKIMHLEGKISITDMASKKTTGESGEVVDSSVNTKFKHYKFPTRKYYSKGRKNFQNRLKQVFGNKGDCEKALNIINRQENIIFNTGILFPRDRVQNFPIKKLKPFSDLKNLKTLILNLNEISDVGPISGLTGLYHLALYKKNISVDLYHV